jgi:hypothetical protein
MRRLAGSATGPRLRPRWRKVGAGRIVHVLARIVELFAALLLAGGIVLASVLARGPIQLTGLHDQIASSLQERVGDRYAVALGPTHLMHDSWGVALGFGGLTLQDAAGRIVLSAPGGKVGLDLLALLAAQVKVNRLELDGLYTRLRVAADGGLSIAVSRDQNATPIALPVAAVPGDGAFSLPALVRTGADAMAGASQAIDRLTLAKGHLEIDNEATGNSMIYDDFAVVFDRSGGRARASISATGPVGPWTIEAEASTGDAPTLTIRAQDLSLADFQAFNKRPPSVFAEGPIAFKFDARLTPEGAIDSMAGRFSLGAGRVRINNPDAEPLLIDETTGKFEWDSGRQRLRIDQVVILAGETRVAAVGWLTPPSAADNAWAGHLESKEARLGPERQGQHPVVLDSMVADARYSQTSSHFVLDRLSARGATVDASLKAETAPDGAGASLKLDLRVGASSTPDLVRLWPQFINPDVRDWCSHNLHGGQLQGSMTANWTAADLDAMAHKRALPRESVHGEFSTRDVAVDLLPGLPLLVSSEGSGSFTGRDFTLSGDHATMTLSPSRHIQADTLVFTVPDTTPAAIVNAQAKAHLTGTADALADLLSREPLRRQAAVSLDPATVRGQAEGDLDLDLKLGKTARPEDTGFHAKGALANLQIDKFLADERLEQATATFQADRNTLKLAGEGELLGAPIRIDVGRSAGEEGTATLTFSLDPAARAKRGLNFGQWLTGPLLIKLKAPLSRASADVEMDLTQAGVDNPIPGVVKPAGKPGKATFQVKPGPDGATLNNIAVDLGAAAFHGSADVGPDGSILSAKITQARLSPGDDLKADIANSPAGLKATVRGTALDGRPFIRSLWDAGPSQPGARDFDLDVKIASVTGANRQSIAGLELQALRRSGDVRLAFLRGHIGAGIVGAGREPGGDLRLTTTDAGALARFADLYSRMEGGSLNLVLRTGADASAGNAVLTNFVLRDEPAFRQLVAAGQANATARGGANAPAPAPVDPSAVRFQGLKAAFVRSPGRLDIQDAVIYNPSMGLTAQGEIDFERNEIDVSGSFVPAYQLNTILTKIPVVGAILSGGQNEGVFGLSYRVHGPMSGPLLTINPLSAMAPGILRKIIGAVDGTASHGAVEPNDTNDPDPPPPRPRR